MAGKWCRKNPLAAVLTAAVAASSNSLPVANTNDFESSGYILIGTSSSKTGELIQAGTISGLTIPLVINTQLAHNQYDLVYALFGNQLKRGKQN